MEQFPGKCEAVFRPELRETKARNSRESAKRFSVPNGVKGAAAMGEVRQ
jgi:hypothetical protein